MRTPLIIGAVLALTTWPALAQDKSYDRDGGRGWREDHRSYGRDWHQDHDDMGDRADRGDRDTDDARADRRGSMHDMHDGMRGRMQGGMGQMRSNMGGSFMIRSGDTRLAVRCDPEETMRACVDAALLLLDRVQARATVAKPEAGTPPAANQ